MKRRNISDEEVIAAYNKHGHIGKIATHLSVPHVQAWRLCQRLGLQTAADKGGGWKQKIPLDEILQIVPRQQPSWSGDCWKAWAKLRFENSIWNMRILELCSGCGVIDKSGPTSIPDLALPNDDYYKLPYSFLNQNRKMLLNLMTVNEFLSTLK